MFQSCRQFVVETEVMLTYDSQGDPRHEEPTRQITPIPETNNGNNGTRAGNRKRMLAERKQAKSFAGLTEEEIPREFASENRSTASSAGAAHERCGVRVGAKVGSIRTSTRDGGPEGDT